MEVIIVSPFRTGTSTVTRILHHVGINMSKYLSIVNGRVQGKVEDRNFFSLNMRILKKAVLPPFGFGKIPTVDQIKMAAEPFLLEIQELIKERREGNGGQDWGYKVPMSCLTMEVFHPYLICPYYITIDRNPENAALSILKRSSGNLGRIKTMRTARRIVSEYYTRANAFLSKQFRVLHINFDRLVSKHTCNFEINSLLDFVNRLTKHNRILGLRYLKLK